MKRILRKGKKMKKYEIFILFFVILITVDSEIKADSPPSLINYQGILTDTEGVPLEGYTQLEFNIYDAEISGCKIWGSQTLSDVLLIKGKFNVILGPKDENDKSITDAFRPDYNKLENVNDSISDNRFLEIKVNDKVLQPRQQILSAPYSFWSETTNTATVARTVRGDNMIIKENGNVGIGTDEPNAKLEVKGNIIANPPTENNHVVIKKYLNKWGETEKIVTHNCELFDYACKLNNPILKCEEGYYVVGILPVYRELPKKGIIGQLFKEFYISDISIICRPVGNN